MTRGSWTPGALRGAALAIAAAWMAGCGGGDGLPREPVSGTVTLDGKPLPSGRISFLPNDPKMAGAGARADIVDGAFAVPASEGPVPGPYRVAISAPAPADDAAGAAAKRKASKTFEDTGGTGASDAPEEAALRETIPPQYNANTGLSAEVKKGAENVLRFDLVTR